MEKSVAAARHAAGTERCIKLTSTRRTAAKACKFAHAAQKKFLSSQTKINARNQALRRACEAPLLPQAPLLFAWPLAALQGVFEATA